MKLTIGMIVKNEEKYLERCLNAIKPILDNVDSELIITDTGSTDNTVEIAKKYTDKILHFEWINDFAAARNSGLEVANGEWFMYIDADEIFRSCDDIINFFNSEEYINYDAASFKLINWNYDENEGKVNNDFYVVRFVNVFNGARFSGAIHEQIDSLGSKIKTVNDVADHYGYLFETTDEKVKKGKRNLDILLKELENNKNDPQTCERIFDTYRVLGDDEKALRYLNDAIKTCMDTYSEFVFTLLVDKAFYFFAKKEYLQAVKVCNEYFDLENKYEIKEIAADAEMLAINGNSYYAVGEYSNAINEYIKFFRTFLNLKSGRISSRDMYYMTFAIATDSRFLQIISLFIESCIKENRYYEAKQYALSLPVKDYCYDKKQICFLVDSEIKLLNNMGFQDVTNYYESFDEIGKNIFCLYLVKEIINSQNKDDIIKALTEITKDDGRNDVLEAAKVIAEAIRLRSEKQYKECIAELKRAVTIYEPIAPVVSDYCNEVLAELESSVKAEPQDEMQKLAGAIKKNIRDYINTGNVEAARKTLNDFKQLMPGDSDIDELEKMIK